MLMWSGIGSSSPETYRRRKDCQAVIDNRYGYLRSRSDLRAYPHGELMPVPVKVRVSMELVK